MRPNWFIAFPIDADDWFAPLVESAPEKLRVFAPADLHMTLAFLGGVGEEAAGAAWTHLLAHLPEAVHDVTLGPVQPFGHPRRPSAFSLTLDSGREAVCDIMRSLTNPLREAAGVEPERREPRPHVTVVRPRRKASQDERDAALRWAEQVPPPQHRFSVGSVALYTWSRNRKITLFQRVEEVGLP